MLKLETALHTAWIDAVTGCGWVTAPVLDGPLFLDGPLTAPVAVDAVDLAATDYGVLVRRLVADGWEVLDDAGPVGVLPDGRDLFVLYHDDSMVEPDMDDLEKVEREFVQSTGAAMAAMA